MRAASQLATASSPAAKVQGIAEAMCWALEATGTSSTSLESCTGVGSCKEGQRQCGCGKAGNPQGLWPLQTHTQVIRAGRKECERAWKEEQSLYSGHMALHQKPGSKCLEDSMP